MYNFDINSFLAPAVNSAKVFSGMIPSEPLRKAIEAAIEANAELVKTIFAEGQKSVKSFK
jgi:hypothetical protein